VRRSLALPLLLGVLGLLLWWLLERSGGDPLPATEQPAQAPQIAAAPPLQSPGADTAAITRADAPAGEETAPASAMTLTVRVVFAHNGSAAAGAEVLLWPLGHGSSVPERERVAYQQANTDEQLDRWGRVFACDADGMTRIPLPEGDWFPIGARANGLWGRRDVKTADTDPSSEIVIELRPALHLRVLVVDERRQPVAGVTVAYRALRGVHGHNLEEAITGTDGIAVLSHLQEEYARHLGREYQHVAAISLPFEPTVQAVFDPLAPPVDPIVLVLPGTGSVEIEVFDLAGRPVEGLAIALQKQMSEEDHKRYTSGRGMEHQSWLGLRWERARNGVVRFERVGLGLTLEYGADFENTGVIESGSGLGPLRPGEHVKFTLRQSIASPTLTGRITDAEGQPLPGKDLEGDMHSEGTARNRTRVRLRTDEDGRFHTPIALDPDDASPKSMVISESRRGLVQMVVVDLPAPLSPGENHLGDLVLGGPLLVAGLALTPGGEPAPTAYGFIDQNDSSREFGSRNRSPFSSISWEADERGRFEVRGNLPVGRYRINAWAPTERNWRCEPSLFNSGAENLELRFFRPSSIRGRIIADPEVHLQDLAIQLAQPDGSTGTSPFDDGGEFSLLALKPGIYDLEVRHGVNGSLLWSRRGLTLVAEGSLDVGIIDLRGLLRTRLTLLDPDGNSVRKANIWIMDPDEVRSWGSSATSLPVTLLHTSSQAVAWIEAPEFARLKVALNGGEQTVRFAPGFRVAVVLEGLPAEAEGWGWRLDLQLQSGPDQPISSRREQILDPGSNTASLALPAAGSWMVILYSRIDPQATWRSIPGALGDPGPTIEVSSASGVQEFRFTVDSAAIARALANR